MRQLLLVTVFLLVPLMSDGWAQDSKRASKRRLHFQPRSLDAIDQGMIESEKEHRRIVLQQLRRSFVTGQSQLTSGTPAVQRASWGEKLFNLYPGR